MKPLTIICSGTLDFMMSSINEQDKNSFKIAMKY
jgi:hypothetical protein